MTAFRIIVTMIRCDPFVLLVSDRKHSTCEGDTYVRYVLGDDRKEEVGREQGGKVLIVATLVTVAEMDRKWSSALGSCTICNTEELTPFTPLESQKA